MLFLAQLERRARPLPRPVAVERANEIPSLEALLEVRVSGKVVLYNLNTGPTLAAIRSDWKSPSRKCTEKIPGCEGLCPAAGMEPIVIVNFSSIGKY
jgi:hypothetical protein